MPRRWKSGSPTDRRSSPTRTTRPRGATRPCVSGSRRRPTGKSIRKFFARTSPGVSCCGFPKQVLCDKLLPHVWHFQDIDESFINILTNKSWINTSLCLIEVKFWHLYCTIFKTFAASEHRSFLVLPAEFLERVMKSNPKIGEKKAKVFYISLWKLLIDARTRERKKKLKPAEGITFKEKLKKMEAEHFNELMNRAAAEEAQDESGSSRPVAFNIRNWERSWSRSTNLIVVTFLNCW